MKEGIRQRTAQPLVEQDEHGGHFDALIGEAVAIAPALACEEAMGPELAHAVTKTMPMGIDCPVSTCAGCLALRCPRGHRSVPFRTGERP